MRIDRADSECTNNKVYFDEELFTDDGDRHLRRLDFAREDGSSESFQVETVLTCLHDQSGDVSLAQILFHEPDTSSLIHRVTFSFRQVEPEVLRMTSEDVHGGDADVVASDPGTDYDFWISPAAEDRPVISDANTLDWYKDASDRPEQLKNEILTLDLLQAHAAEIDKEIKATQQRIMTLWKADFNECSSVKCFLKTAFKKTPSFLHLLATHLGHHHNHINADSFRKYAHMNCTAEVDRVVHQSGQTAMQLDESASTINADDLDIVEEVFPTTSASDAVTQITDDVDATESTPSSEEPQRTQPAGHRGPPWRGGRPPWARPGSRPHFYHTGDNHTPAASPPFDSTYAASHHNHYPQTLSWPNISFETRFKLAFALTACILVFLSGLTLCLILTIRRCRDPRRRADRAALREERRSRALYRKAACKYRFTTFWKRVGVFFTFAWLRERVGLKWCECVDEKQGLIIATTTEIPEPDSPSSSVGSVVTPQIASLRAAHSFVASLVQKKTQQRQQQQQTTTHSPTSATPSSPAPSQDVDTDTRSLRSITSTLPPYSLPPPSYRGVLGRGDGGSDIDVSVVDGFTPSATDETPESSVVSCGTRSRGGSFDSERVYGGGIV